MKTRIIVDSTADLTPEYAERVQIVPLTVHFGDEEFIDGFNISPFLTYGCSVSINLSSERTRPMLLT